MVCVCIFFKIKSGSRIQAVIKTRNMGHYKTWVSIPVVKLAKKSMHKVFNGEKGGTKKNFLLTGNVSITVNNVYSWK